jgi:hypothetical protein
MNNTSSRKKVIVIVVLLITVAVIACVVVFGSSNRKEGDDTVNQPDDGYFDDEYWEVTKDFMEGNTFAMTNRYDLTARVGYTASLKVYYILEQLVLGDEELNSSPHENEVRDDLPKGYFIGIISRLSSGNNPYDMSIESSMTKFRLEISDGRIYTINTLMNARGGYSSILVSRVGWGGSRLYIDNGGDYFESEILPWVDSLGFNTENLDVRNVQIDIS